MIMHLRTTHFRVSAKILRIQHGLKIVISNSSYVYLSNYVDAITTAVK